MRMIKANSYAQMTNYHSTRSKMHAHTQMHTHNHLPWKTNPSFKTASKWEGIILGNNLTGVQARNWGGKEYSIVGFGHIEMKRSRYEVLQQDWHSRSCREKRVCHRVEAGVVKRWRTRFNKFCSNRLVVWSVKQNVHREISRGISKNTECSFTCLSFDWKCLRRNKPKIGWGRQFRKADTTIATKTALNENGKKDKQKIIKSERNSEMKRKNWW